MTTIKLQAKTRLVAQWNSKKDLEVDLEDAGIKNATKIAEILNKNTVVLKTSWNERDKELIVEIKTIWAEKLAEVIKLCGPMSLHIKPGQGVTQLLFYSK